MRRALGSEIALFALLAACAAPVVPPDAAPFAGAIAALDRDHDGVVAVAEYPDDGTGTMPVAEVDRDHDGTVSLVEVRDAVYAVDPAGFDQMALPHFGAGGEGAAPPGPLGEALRFLVAVQAERAPETTAPTSEEWHAAAAAGMDSPAGAVVLARLAAGGVHVPDALVHAPADPPPANGPPARAPMKVGERLKSAGPSGKAAVWTPPMGPAGGQGGPGAPGGPPPGSGPPGAPGAPGGPPGPPPQ